MRVKVLNVIDDKTFKAVSVSYKKHLQYGKYITRHKNYLVHSEGVKVEKGTEVEILPSKPFSKTKRWSLKV